MSKQIKIVEFQRFYKALKPNITTSKSGILYFNSSDNEEDNAFPQKLQDLKQKSSIHSFFLNLKAALIYSGGLYPYDDNNAGLAEFLKSKNRIGDTVQKVFQKCCVDFADYEQCFVEIIYNEAGGIFEIYHRSVAHVRASEELDEFGQPVSYFVSNTWGDVTNKRYKGRRNNVSDAVEVPAFNPENSIGKQIFHIKRYDGTDNVYTIPSYLAAEHWINVIHLIGEYVQNKFEGGYHLDGFLYLNSTMNEDEQNEFVKDFKRKYQGTKGNKLVFLFNDIATAKPEFVPIQDALNNSIFKEYMGEAIKQTVFAHQGSLKLLDLSNNDSFGNSNASANDINITRLKYINDVVKPYQSDLLDGFNRLFAVNNLGEVTLLNETLKLSIPELQEGDTTRSERREIVLGLNPLPEDLPQATTTGQNDNIDTTPTT